MLYKCTTNAGNPVKDPCDSEEKSEPDDDLQYNVQCDPTHGYTYQLLQYMSHNHNRNQLATKLIAIE